jgi:hypothetical protein
MRISGFESGTPIENISSAFLFGKITGKAGEREPAQTTVTIALNLLYICKASFTAKVVLPELGEPHTAISLLIRSSLAFCKKLILSQIKTKLTPLEKRRQFA